MSRIGQRPNPQLQQQISKATQNDTVSKKELKGLINTAQADGVVDAGELDQLTDLFQRGAASAGFGGFLGATQHEAPVKMAKGTGKAFMNFLMEQHKQNAIPDLEQPVNPTLATVGQIPLDVIPDMEQPINPNLGGVGQVPADVIPDMEQPINPDLATAGQVPADVIPDMEQPINPDLATIGQVPSDVIPDMEQPINPNLGGVGQVPADVIPDMEQPINPDLSTVGQVPADVIPDMEQPINPNLGNVGQIPGDVIPDMPQVNQLRIADPGQFSDHLIDNGVFGQLADLAGFDRLGTNGPEGDRSFSQAVVAFNETPSQEAFDKLDTIMQGVPYELSLTTDGLEALMNDSSQGVSIREQLTNIDGIIDVAFQSNPMGQAKPVLFQRGRLSESAQAQIADIMSQAHLDYEVDNALSFFGR